jgi:hypothetical protein
MRHYTSDELEICRHGQIVATVPDHWNTDDNFIAFAGNLVNLRAGDQIKATKRAHDFRAFNVHQLLAQTTVFLETEADYQRRITTAHAGIHINMTNSVYQNNGAGVTRRMTIGKHEGGLVEWLGSAFGFNKRAVMFFMTGKAE